MHTVITSPPAVSQSFLDEESGLPVILPRIPFTHGEISGNQFVYALCTPTAVNSSFNPFDETEVSAGATVVKDANGFGSMTRAYFYSLTARIADDPSADLLENSITLYAGNNQIARIQVEATTQKTGQAVFIGDGSNGDGMFALDQTAALTVSGGAIEETDNIYTKVGHGLETMDRVVLTGLTGGTGLTAGQIYFFHKLSSSTGYLCSTQATARAGSAINVTLDASTVILTRYNDIGLTLSQVDPNLVIDIRVVGTDA